MTPLSLPTLAARERERACQCPNRRAGVPGTCGLIDIAVGRTTPLPIDECDGCWKLGWDTEKGKGYRDDFISDLRDVFPEQVAGGCCSGVKRLFARSPLPFFAHLQAVARTKGYTLTPEALLTSKGAKIGCPDEVHVFTILGVPWVRWSDRKAFQPEPLHLAGYFDRVVVISLARRPDRLARFRANFTPERWPFKQPEVFVGIDGDRCPPPRNWIAGGGAWGCMQSHRQILERALSDGTKRLLVLEDDAHLPEEFPAKVAAFLKAVPPDWDQLMLGGQHIDVFKNPPPGLPGGVVRCLNCQRTHAYAVQGGFMQELYRVWQAGTTHCDHIMGPLQRHRKVYAPEPMLIGQEEGRSDISGRTNPRTFWKRPGEDRPIALITNNPPPAQLGAANTSGFHRGFTLTKDGVDVTLEAAIQTSDPVKSREYLRKWLSFVDWECAQYPDWLPTLYHPRWKEREGGIREVLGDRLVEVAWLPGMTTKSLMKAESTDV
jgi:hypothetical protein